MSIAPISYNPDVNDSTVPKASGIGLTFTERVLAGSGNVTLRIAGAAGTVVENFGVGSSVTINNNTVSIDPTSDLNAGETYHISYPSGAFTNTGGDVSYVGTAYTFGVKPEFAALLIAGRNSDGSLGLNDLAHRSSPTQIPGITWSTEFCNGESSHAIKTDGTLWGWGDGYWGNLGVNSQADYSSPVQIPGTTWSKVNNYGGLFTAAVKTDGTLWAWGHNGGAQLGQNNTDNYSSPRQIPGTTWKDVSPQYRACMAIKTDGTLWGWGGNNGGQLGLNNATYSSSPIQIPGTSWNTLGTGDYNGCCVRTDGTLWVWGHGAEGALAQNNTSQYSSPKQIPGTNWVKCESFRYGAYATKSDGTLWAWGKNSSNNEGALGQNNTTSYSSPVQIPGTNWHTTRWHAGSGVMNIIATKTDGTLWAWGNNTYGNLGQNNRTSYSSPIQVPGTSWTAVSRGTDLYALMAIGVI
jgi:alpha-tubulin suppressor-like RCC1 family protein